MSEVRLVGLDALAAIPANARRVLMDALGQAGEEALLGLIPDLADYPAQPAGSTYRRTGTLGRLWTSAKPSWQSKPTGFIGTLGNATSYGPYVQGDDQAPGNDHWQTAGDVLDGHTAEIVGIFEGSLEDAAKQLEGGG